MAARRLHHLIYVTIANCCLFLIVCGIAIGTNKWFSSSSTGSKVDLGQVTVSYGLFKGVKTKQSMSLVQRRYNIELVCKGMKGCMFSCGVTAQKRKQDLESLLDGMDEQDYCWCSELVESCGDAASSSDSLHNANATVKTRSSGNNSAAINADETEGGSSKRLFINFGLYLSTIGFLGLAMIFAIVSGMLALYNTYRTPSHPVLSVYGLYFWNGISAGFVLLAMIMWLIEFTTRLRKNAAISDTLSGIQDSNGTGSLGVSFWILILPLLFALANIAILKYRSWKIVKMNEKTLRVMKTEDENGETILF